MSDWKLKYRPKNTEELVGNDEIVEAFTNDITGDDKKRAYLISGPHGIGKTSLARIGAIEFLGCNDFTVSEINASDDRGIDMVRELKERCSVHTSTNRAWIIDEVQETTKAFQNAILKLLEEGSEKDFFFLCTTDPKKLLPTVKSRCGKYPLEKPEDIEIKKRLRIISKAEKIMVAPEITIKILEKAEGHVRDAVGFLQSVHKMEEEKALKYLERCVGGDASSPEAFTLVKAIYNGHDKTIKSSLKQLKENKENPEGLRIFILSYGATMLLNKWDLNTAKIMQNFEDPYFDNSAWSKFVLDCFRSTCTSDIPF